jgi:molybdenum cofactor guanylyltransferase
MGRDKLRLRVGGRTLLQRVHDALAARCAEVLLVGAGDCSRDLEGATAVADLRPGRPGPLAGMEAGLAAASNPRVFVAAGDLPFLPVGLVDASLGLLDRGARAVVPRHGGTLHPLCAAYDRRLVAEVGGALDSGTRSVIRFLEGLGGVSYLEGEELRAFGEPEVFLMNVNSPEDLARARAISGKSRP